LKSLTLNNGFSTEGYHEKIFKDCKIESLTVKNNAALNSYLNEAPSTSVLKTVVFGDSVTSIPYSAFSSSRYLTSVTFGSEIESIGSYAFERCPLTMVVIPDSHPFIARTTVGPSAFESCEKLTFVSLGDSVTTIGADAFRGCSSLRTVLFANSLTSIEGGAFYRCSSLESVVIPSSVNTLGNGAFESCEKLSMVTLGSNSAVGSYKTAFSTAYIKNVILGNKVTAIYSNSFEVTSLETILIPNSVTSIGSRAFSTCYSLRSLTIPPSVTSISDSTFANSGITSIIIGDSVTSIGESAFYGCDELTSIIIPHSVSSIGNKAFYDCRKLTNVFYFGSEDPGSSSSDVFYNPSSIQVTVPENYEDNYFCGKQIRFSLSSGSHLAISLLVWLLPAVFLFFM